MNLPSADDRTEPFILVVDLETTGTDARKNSIIQFGAVWISGAAGEIELDCRIWDGAEIVQKALERNGCSEARCRNPALMTEAEALDQFFTWCFMFTGSDDQPFMLAGLNPSFDRAFLMKAWIRAGHRSEDFPIRHRTLDLHTLAVSYAFACDCIVPSRGLYTDEIYGVLDMPPEPKPHRAIVGARMEAQAMRRLLLLPDPEEPVPFQVMPCHQD